MYAGWTSPASIKVEPSWAESLYQLLSPMALARAAHGAVAESAGVTGIFVIISTSLFDYPLNSFIDKFEIFCYLVWGSYHILYRER